MKWDWKAWFGVLGSAETIWAVVGASVVAIALAVIAYLEGWLGHAGDWLRHLSGPSKPAVTARPTASPRAPASPHAEKKPAVHK